MRRYKLVFDNREPVFVDAEGSTEAIEQYQGRCAAADGSCNHRSITDCVPRPHTITDLTAIAAIVARRPGVLSWPEPPALNEDAPLRSWVAKEL